jgi:hypothetical protein
MMNLQGFLLIVFFSPLSSSPLPAITVGIFRDFFLFIIMFFPYLHLTPSYFSYLHPSPSCFP